MVFFGERRQIDFDAGKIDVAFRAEEALCKHLAADAVGVLGKNFHVDDAIIHEHGIAHMDVIHQAIVIHVDGKFLFAACTADGEFKNLTGLEIELR